MGVVCLFSISASITRSEDIIGTCDENWYEIPNYGCFLVGTELSGKNWLEAQIYCKDRGGYLAEPRNAKLQNELTQLMRELAPEGYAIWIGATDLFSDGIWRWTSSGTNITESFWSTGCPTEDDGNNCVYMSTSFGITKYIEGRRSWHGRFID